MQKITLNGLEIEIEDGVELAIEDGGKRIVVKAKPAVVEHHHYPAYPVFPVYPQPVIITQPYTPPAGWPTITCGTGTTSGPAIGGLLTSGAQYMPTDLFKSQNFC